MSEATVVLRYAAEELAVGGVIGDAALLADGAVALPYAVALGIERLLGEELAAGSLGTAAYWRSHQILDRYAVRCGGGSFYTLWGRSKPSSSGLAAVLRDAADDHDQVVAGVLRYAVALVIEHGGVGYAYTSGYDYEPYDVTEPSNPWLSSVDVSALVSCAAEDLAPLEAGWTWQSLADSARDELNSYLAAACGAQAPDWFVNRLDADLVAALYAAADRCTSQHTGGAA